ncbi:hypothetical protein [Amycolatopsis samaneae]|uniref:Uncharacterized protein n=1 Tax=Amycolatopsis samaneae TaxID=664691 RepID=A0ABW5GBT8_9PSEU
MKIMRSFSMLIRLPFWLVIAVLVGGTALGGQAGRVLGNRASAVVGATGKEVL